MSLTDIATIYVIVANAIAIAEAVARWTKASRTHGKRKGR